MPKILNLDTCAFIAREFPGVPKTGSARERSYVVVLDMATNLASELAETREKLTRKLSAMLVEGDWLTLWWVRGIGLSGEFCSEFKITNPQEDVHKLLEQYMTDASLQVPGLAPAQMHGAASSLIRNAEKADRSLIGYLFVDGFCMPSAYAELDKVLPLLNDGLSFFFVGEYACNESGISDVFDVVSGAVGNRCVYARDQLDEQTSFEEAIRSVAGFSFSNVALKEMSPPEEFGFVVYLVGQQPMVSYCDDEDRVRIPAGVTEFAYFSETETVDEVPYYPQMEHPALLWVALAYAQSMDEDLDVRTMLEEIGDAFLLNMHFLGEETGDYYRYELACLEAAFNPNCRYRQGMLVETHARNQLSAPEVEAQLSQWKEAATEVLGELERRQNAIRLVKPWMAAILAIAFVGAAIFAYHAA